MMYPTTEQITKLGGDRYLVTIAAAKGARKITEEYVAQREAAEKLIATKTLYALIDADIRDDKAVKTSIKRLMSGRYQIVTPKEK